MKKKREGKESKLRLRKARDVRCYTEKRRRRSTEVYETGTFHPFERSWEKKEKEKVRQIKTVKERKKGC